MNTSIKRFLSTCLLGAILLSGAAMTAHAESVQSAEDAKRNTVKSLSEKENALWDEMVTTYGSDDTWSLEVWAEYSQRCAEQDITLIDGMVYGVPAEDEVQLEEALEIAGNHLLDTMGFKPEVLARFKTYVIYLIADDALPEDWKPSYRISYNPINVEDAAEIGFYNCVVSGKTGEVLEFSTPADGKG